MLPSRLQSTLGLRTVCAVRCPINRTLACAAVGRSPRTAERKQCCDGYPEFTANVSVNLTLGGDEDKIRRLQCKLNELKIGGHLTEDGIYGKKTDTVRSALLDELARGTIPALRWIDPLQSNSTGIRTVTKTVRDGRTFSRLVRDGSNTPLFRADLHPYKGNSN
mgnify:FL=1